MAVNLERRKATTKQFGSQLHGRVGHRHAEEHRHAERSRGGLRSRHAAAIRHCVGHRHAERSRGGPRSRDSPLTTHLSPLTLTLTHDLTYALTVHNPKLLQPTLATLTSHPLSPHPQPSPSTLTLTLTQACRGEETARTGGSDPQRSTLGQGGAYVGYMLGIVGIGVS